MDFLREALEQLDELDEYAAELGYEIPNASVKASAKMLVVKLIEEHPDYYMIAPSELGWVLINASVGKNHYFLIACKSDGKVSCFLSRKGKHAQKHYDSCIGLPDSFLAGALQD